MTYNEVVEEIIQRMKEDFLPYRDDPHPDEPEWFIEYCNGRVDMLDNILGFMENCKE